MSQVVCLTGMHRSGTSLTASWLQKCGLVIDNGDLINAAVGNPHGHFEDKDFVDLHSELLLNASEASSGWIVSQPLGNLQTEAINLKAKELINARAKLPLWGWKDPRSLLFLEAWDRLIPDLKTIFVWRPANQVVDSLVRRSKKATHPYFKISPALAYKVWVYYNQLLIAYHLKNKERSVVLGIDQILKDSVGCVEHLNKTLDLTLELKDISSMVDSKLLITANKNLSDHYYQFLNKTAKIEAKLTQLNALIT